MLKTLFIPRLPSYVAFVQVVSKLGDLFAGMIDDFKKDILAEYVLMIISAWLIR